MSNRLLALGWISAVLCAVPLLSSTWARGEEAPLFPQGAQNFTLAGSYAQAIWTGGNDNEFGGQDDNFASVSQAYGYNLFDNIVVVPKITERYVISDGHDAIGADFTLGLRWHFLQVDRWTFFVSAAGGAGDFSRRVPVGTTNFNFTSQLGGGLTYQLRDNLHLIAGLDWTHFSNFEIAGAPRHGGSNTAELSIGLMWTF